MHALRTWFSGPRYLALRTGFQDLESSPSYGRLIFFSSLFSASSGHRRTHGRTRALAAWFPNPTVRAESRFPNPTLSRPGFQDLDIWLSGPGFHTSTRGFRTWVSGPQREVSRPASQDLPLRTSPVVTDGRTHGRRAGLLIRRRNRPGQSDSENGIRPGCSAGGLKRGTVVSRTDARTT
jgi:hypothetical protein